MAGIAHASRRDLIFWAGWALILAVFVLLAIGAHRSAALPLDDALSIRLERYHDSFRYSGTFWGYLGDLGTPPVIVAVVLIAAGALLSRGALAEAAFVVGALPFALVQIATQALVDRPVDHISQPDRQYALASSFPSGHAFGEFMVFGLIFAFAPLIAPWRAATVTIRVACVILIVLGALERMANIAHWPSDVLGADLLALLYVAPAVWFSSKLRDRERE